MTIAQDAAFLSNHQLQQQHNSGVVGVGSRNNNNNVNLLHHQHLLQVQCDELIALSLLLS
jgi:hypothetical protein